MIDPVTKTRRRSTARPPRTGRVYNLTASPVDGVFADRSGKGNDMAVYSGWYPSLNGSTDYISIDAGTIASGSTLTFKARSASDATIHLSSGDISFTADGTWKDVSAAISGDLSAWTIGKNGADFWAGDICDVKITGSDGTVLGHWPLQERPSGTLTGYPAFDSSGNGNHGTYTGCTGNNGDGPDAEVVGLEEYGSEYWLNGSSQRLNIPTQNISGDFDISVYFLSVDNSLNSAFRRIFSDGTSDGLCISNAGYLLFRLDGNNDFSDLVFPIGQINTVRVWRISNVVRMSLNGVTSSSTYTISNAFSITQLGSAGSNNWVEGMVFNLVVNGVSVTPTSVTGSPVTVADKLRTIPQMFLQDWNKRMWFDGVDDFIGLGTGDALGFSGAGKVEWRGWLYVQNASSGPFLLQKIATLNAGCVLNISSGNMEVFARSQPADSIQTHSAAIGLGWHYVKLYADFANDEIGISIDNGVYSTATVSFGSSTYVNGTPTGQQYIGRSETAYFKGIVGPCELLIDDVQTEVWTAKGNTSADWNGATVNGSPANIYLPSSLTDPTKDALGNDIDRPRGSTLNLTGVAGDYAEIADSASLDITGDNCTWAMVGNFWDDEAVLRYIYHRFEGTDNRVWMFYRDDTNVTSSDGSILLYITQDGTIATRGLIKITGFTNTIQTLIVVKSGTSLTAYIDGVEATITTVSGSVPATLFQTDIGIRIGQDFDGANPSDQLIGKPLLYDRALTESEVGKLHRALKRYT